MNNCNTHHEPAGSSLFPASEHLISSPNHLSTFNLLLATCYLPLTKSPLSPPIYDHASGLTFLSSSAFGSSRHTTYYYYYLLATTYLLLSTHYSLLAISSPTARSAAH